MNKHHFLPANILVIYGRVYIVKAVFFYSKRDGVEWHSLYIPYSDVVQFPRTVFVDVLSTAAIDKEMNRKFGWKAE